MVSGACSTDFVSCGFLCRLNQCVVTDVFAFCYIYKQVHIMHQKTVGITVHGRLSSCLTVNFVFCKSCKNGRRHTNIVVGLSAGLNCCPQTFSLPAAFDLNKCSYLTCVFLLSITFRCQQSGAPSDLDLETPDTSTSCSIYTWCVSWLTDISSLNNACVYMVGKRSLCLNDEHMFYQLYYTA